MGACGFHCLQTLSAYLEENPREAKNIVQVILFPHKQG